MFRLLLTVLMISEMTFLVSLGKSAYKREGKVIEVKTNYIKILDRHGTPTGKHIVEEKAKKNSKPRSCLDLLRNGETGAKVFTITTPNGLQEVLCDLTSEPGSAWTLVLSHRMEYRYKDTIAPFKKPLHMNLPVNEKSPNYNMYRMTRAKMTNIKSQSTHWRVTCNGPSQVDYRDYLRARFADFDPLTFIGGGVCKKVEYINVRGHVGIGVTAAFWQIANREILHHDSNARSCSFGASPGYAPSEDNFGYYHNINRGFRCSASNSSTSNMWFGAYL